jgi:hypothetical protein
MRRLLPGGLACVAGLLLLPGCQSIRPLPVAYLEQEHDATVVIKRMPPNATMRDSGEGGLIGAFVTMGRGSNMEKKLAGIQGETVRELFLQEFSRHLGEHFVINQQTNDLKIQVIIMNWGWFVPTTVLGIKTGAYQCEMSGVVEVFDMKNKKKKIALMPVQVQRPLGNKPEEVAAKEAIVEVAQAFAVEAERLLTTPRGSKAKPQKT